MNKIEVKIYNSTKKVPFLKDFIKYIYQIVFSFFSKKETWSINKIYTRKNCFFGFHDKSPWSKDSKYLLSHNYNGMGNESIFRKGPINIAIFSGKNWLEKKIIAKTSAWNWQQGSQLQWLGESKKIIFNDFHSKKCVSKVLDVENSEEKVIPYPIGAVSPDGKIFATFCYETLGKTMPGYGYDFKFFKAKSYIAPMHLLVGELEKTNILYSLDCSQIKSEFLNYGKKRSKSCISHIQFSPDGKRLIFMKRLALPSLRLKTELFLLNIENQSIKRFPFRDMISHYCFLNNEEILTFANTTKKGDNFYLVNLSTMKCKNLSPFLNDRDGHPSCSSQGIVVFDTYPDRSRHQDLFLWNYKKERKAKKIAKLYSPFSFRGENRVDLHPRISSDGRLISFDSSFTNIRSLSTMNLK